VELRPAAAVRVEAVEALEQLPPAPEPVALAALVAQRARQDLVAAYR